MIIESEEELLYTIKQWIQKRGTSVLMASLIFLAVAIGWYAAKRQNDNRLSQATVLYEDVLKSFNEQDVAQAEKQANYLIETYKQTPYAKLTAMLMAKNLTDEEKLDLARKQLSFVMEKAKIPAIRQIARLRLARIWLSENRYEKALAILNSVDEPIFFPLIEEVKGDIQYAAGDKTLARDAYQNAIKNWPENFPGKEMIKLKLQQL